MKFIGAVVVAVIAVLLTYYLNLKSPDLAYQLSSPIDLETSPPDAPPKIVQQIEVLNTGNALAQSVQIRIRKRVGVITLTKDSENDKYEQFKHPQGGTELDYEALRPGGRIKVSLSGGDPLVEQDLEIRHQDGVARSGLTPENRVWSWGREVLFFGPMLLYFWLSGRAMAKDWFAIHCRVNPIETIKTQKPFWLPHKVWVEGLEDAATRAPRPQLEETSDVSSWHIHRLLNSGKPESLPDDMWAKILPELIDGFISRLTTAAERNLKWLRPEEIHKLLALPKPSAVFDEKWNKFKGELAAIYSTAVVTRAMRFSEYAEPLNAVQSVTLDQSEREKLWRMLQSLYCMHLVKEIVHSLDSVETLNRADLRLLPSSDVEALSAFANGRRHSALADAIRCIISGVGLDSEAPREIHQDEWIDLKRIEKEIRTARDRYEDRRAEVDQRGTALAPWADTNS